MFKYWLNLERMNQRSAVYIPKIINPNSITTSLNVKPSLWFYLPTNFWWSYKHTFSWTVVDSSRTKDELSHCSSNCVQQNHLKSLFLKVCSLRIWFRNIEWGPGVFFFNQALQATLKQILFCHNFKNVTFILQKLPFHPQPSLPPALLKGSWMSSIFRVSCIFNYLSPDSRLHMHLTAVLHREKWVSDLHRWLGSAPKQ